MQFPPFILSEFSTHDFDKFPIFGRKINFSNIENIPKCELFSYSNKPLEFISVPGNNEFSVINVPIKAALELMDESAYEIHSERWYRVRKQFSQSNITHFPWIYINTDGKVALMDGRHRLIAMMLFKGMESVPVQVEPNLVEEIQKYFENLTNN